jgi:hypothetical protein
MVDALSLPGATIEQVAQTALYSPGFINNTIKLFSAPFFNKNHLPSAMNDAIAMVMYNVEKNRDYRDIMTTPNTVRVDPTRVQTLIKEPNEIPLLHPAMYFIYL